MSNTVRSLVAKQPPAAMSAVALLYTVALAVAETSRDPGVVARELVQAADVGVADVDALAAAATATSHGHPVLTAARDLTLALHVDVDTLATDAFAAYMRLKVEDPRLSAASATVPA
jgi:hypothetical protein